jgi:hypothetical protein
VMGFSSAPADTRRASRSYINILLGAPASLASTMVIGLHHAAVIHVGGSSEVGQREQQHMVRLGIHRKCWPEFLCLGGYLAPPRQVGGCAPPDALSRHPSPDRHRWRPAGGPPVLEGAQSQANVITQVTG